MADPSHHPIEGPPPCATTFQHPQGLEPTYSYEEEPSYISEDGCSVPIVNSGPSNISSRIVGLPSPLTTISEADSLTYSISPPRSPSYYLPQDSSSILSSSLAVVEQLQHDRQALEELGRRLQGSRSSSSSHHPDQQQWTVEGDNEIEAAHQQQQHFDLYTQQQHEGWRGQPEAPAVAHPLEGNDIDEITHLADDVQNPATSMMLANKRRAMDTQSRLYRLQQRHGSPLGLSLQDLDDLGFLEELGNDNRRGRGRLGTDMRRRSARMKARDEWESMGREDNTRQWSSFLPDKKPSCPAALPSVHLLNPNNDHPLRRARSATTRIETTHENRWRGIAPEPGVNSSSKAASTLSSPIATKSNNDKDNDLTTTSQFLNVQRGSRRRPVSASPRVAQRSDRPLSSSSHGGRINRRRPGTSSSEESEVEILVVDDDDEGWDSGAEFNNRGRDEDMKEATRLQKPSEENQRTERSQPQESVHELEQAFRMEFRAYQGDRPLDDAFRDLFDPDPCRGWFDGDDLIHALNQLNIKTTSLLDAMQLFQNMESGDGSHVTRDDFTAFMERDKLCCAPMAHLEQDLRQQVIHLLEEGHDIPLTIEAFGGSQAASGGMVGKSRFLMGLAGLGLDCLSCHDAQRILEKYKDRGTGTTVDAARFLNDLQSDPEVKSALLTASMVRQAQEEAHNLIRASHRAGHWVFDLSYHVVMLGARLGIRPITDRSLMWIADKALYSGLPSEWELVVEAHDDSEGIQSPRCLFLHRPSGILQCSHPLESDYRRFTAEERSKATKAHHVRRSSYSTFEDLKDSPDLVSERPFTTRDTHTSQCQQSRPLSASSEGRHRPISYSLPTDYHTPRPQLDIDPYLPPQHQYRRSPRSSRRSLENALDFANSSSATMRRPSSAKAKLQHAPMNAHPLEFGTNATVPPPQLLEPKGHRLEDGARSPLPSKQPYGEPLVDTIRPIPLPPVESSSNVQEYLECLENRIKALETTTGGKGATSSHGPAAAANSPIKTRGQRLTDRLSEALLHRCQQEPQRTCLEEVHSATRPPQPCPERTLLAEEMCADRTLYDVLRIMRGRGPQPAPFSPPPPPAANQSKRRQHHEQPLSSRGQSHRKHSCGVQDPLATVIHSIDAPTRKPHYYTQTKQANRGKGSRQGGIVLI